MRREWIIAYLVVGIGYHYGQTFNKTYAWKVIIRWALVVVFWPGVVLAHIIRAIGK